jgi:hypothetical protein
MKLILLTLFRPTPFNIWQLSGNDQEKYGRGIRVLKTGNVLE